MLRDLSDSQLLTITLVIVGAAIAIVWLAVLEYRSTDRRCTCGRMRVNKGSHFACSVCDFDPDPRP